jgi:hypothetical protein
MVAIMKRFKVQTQNLSQTRFRPETAQRSPVVRFVGILSILLTVSCPALAADADAKPPTKKELRAITSEVRTAPFCPGETLAYDISVMGVKAGTGILNIKKERDWKGQRVLPIVGKLHTDGFWNNTYPVDDRILSLLRSTRSPHPLHTELKYKRKNSVRDYKLDFSVKKGLLTGTKIDIRNGKSTTRRLSVKAPPGTQDGLSWIYYIRSQNLKPGKRFTYRGHSGNYLYTIDSEVIGTEEVWTRLGFMDAYKLQTTVYRGNRKKKIKEATMWFGTDASKLPIKVTFDFKLGRVEVVLNKAMQPDAALCQSTKNELKK